MKSRSSSISRVVLAVLAVAGAACVSLFLAGASAQQSPTARANSRAISGNGRGLASFSDRGLTTFGDRFSEGFGRRDLTSFSDIPLAPMGGLEIPGPSEARRSSRTRNHHPPRSRRQFDLSSSAFNDSGGTSVSTGGHHAGRSVSIRGRMVTAPKGPPAPLVLPSMRLPSVTLDHRPALERLALALRQELDRVERRGDAGVARALASSRLR